MQFLKSRLGALAAVVTAMVASAMLVAGSAYAAADSTTGIDYSEIGGDTLSSAKPAVIAGVAILTFITAVTLGKKIWNKVSH